MIEDGLVEIENSTVRITEKGIPFVRNCCMAFDQYLLDPIAERSFSLTI
jgi:oxygen-independent coproporphyrinogen-3 oxidase